MFDISIPNPRPRYPDRIQAPAPIGMRESVRRAAAERGISSAAFIREAIETRLRQAASSIEPKGYACI